MDTVAVNQAVHSWMLWEIIKAGGIYIMGPIFLLSLIAIYIGVERYLYYRKLGRYRSDFFYTIYELMKNRDIDAVLRLCQKENSFYAKIIAGALPVILNGNGNNSVNMIETSISYEMARMEKNLTFLKHITSIAPMLGFLGTVVGMINVLMTISTEGGFVDIAYLSEGLYQALITTVAGLIVALESSIIYSALTGYLENMEVRIKEIISSLINLTHERITA